MTQEPLQLTAFPEGCLLPHVTFVLMLRERGEMLENGRQLLRSLTTTYRFQNLTRMQRHGVVRFHDSLRGTPALNLPRTEVITGHV